MKLKVNGKDHIYDGSATIQALLEEMRIDGRQVAIMVNDEIVSRRKFSSTKLTENDRLEIVTFVGGG